MSNEKNVALSAPTLPMPLDLHVDDPLRSCARRAQASEPHLERSLHAGAGG
jgi:hypothetical protein